MRACPADWPGARPDPACRRKCAHWLLGRALLRRIRPARHGRARNALLGADGVKFPGIALLQSGLVVLACLALGGKLILEFLFFFGKQLRPEAALSFLRRPLSPSVGSSITAVAKKSRKRSSTSPNRLFPVTGAACSCSCAGWEPRRSTASRAALSTASPAALCSVFSASRRASSIMRARSSACFCASASEYALMSGSSTVGTSSSTSAGSGSGSAAGSGAFSGAGWGISGSGSFFSWANSGTGSKIGSTGARFFPVPTPSSDKMASRSASELCAGRAAAGASARFFCTCSRIWSSSEAVICGF